LKQLQLLSLFEKKPTFSTAFVILLPFIFDKSHCQPFSVYWRSYCPWAQFYWVDYF